MPESTQLPQDEVTRRPASRVPEPGPRAGTKAAAPPRAAIPLPPPGYTDRQPGDDDQLQDFESQDG